MGFLSLLVTAAALLPSSYAALDPRVQVALTSDTPINGISTTPSGRLFLLYARVDGTQAQGLPEVVEWINGTGVPYPNAAWNSYAGPTSDPSTTLVRVNSQRIGPDGNLWLVDTGSPGFGSPVILPQGPKLVVVDLATNAVARVYPMANVVRSSSLLDDVRFNKAGDKAYLTDAGQGALIVLDLATGRGVRVLDGAESTGAFTPPSAEGNLLRSATGLPAYVTADQMEVSPDGDYFYWQPASGGMSRIETQLLDQALDNSSLATGDVLAGFVEPFALTPSTGGTAIDAEGSIYVSDVDRQAIEKVYANGTRVTVVRDERLLWVDAMWLSSEKKLWMPAAQLNRGVPFSPGEVSRIVKPLYVYTIDVGIGPPPIDHA